MGLAPEGFVSVMCMMFDEYHNVHRDADAAELADTVAELVATVNGCVGNFETAA